MTCPIPVTVYGVLVGGRERNRGAGYSYKSSTSELHFVALFADGSTDQSEFLWSNWQPFINLPGAPPGAIRILAMRQGAGRC